MPENVIRVISSDAASQGALFAEVNTLLLDAGVVRPTFLDALSAREQQFPTGLDFGSFQVAIPHIDPEHVVEPGLLVARLAHPVAFRAMDNRDRELRVKLTLWPLVVDPKKHMKLLAAMLKLLQKPGAYDDLLSGSDERVHELLAKVVNK